MGISQLDQILSHKPILKQFLMNFNICSLILLLCLRLFRDMSLRLWPILWQKALCSRFWGNYKIHTKANYFLVVVIVCCLCNAVLPFWKSKYTEAIYIPFEWAMNKTKYPYNLINYFCWKIFQKYNIHTCMDFIWLLFAVFKMWATFHC